MIGQAVSTSLAWAVVVALFIGATLVLHNREDVPWQAALAFIIGGVFLATAAAITATNALFSGGPPQTPWMEAVIALRAAAAATFFGVILRQWSPTWLRTFVDRLVDRLT